jgi:DNA-binding Lrp family transcriptional regulator
MATVGSPGIVYSGGVLSVENDQGRRLTVVGANAYMMLKVEPAKTLAVAERLRGLTGVGEVHEVLGPFDIIAVIEAPTPEDLAAVLRTKVRAIAGVTETVTCTWLD